MSDDPSDDELVRPAPAKPSDKKPASVWVAQIMCAFGSAGAAYFALSLGELTAKVSMGMLALLYVGLIYGTEKRHAWSRWFLAAFLALGAVSTFVQARQQSSGELNQALGQPQLGPAQRRGVAAGQAASIVLVMLLAGRLAFGAPAKRYFGAAPSARSGQG